MIKLVPHSCKPVRPHASAPYHRHHTDTRNRRRSTHKHRGPKQVAIKAAPSALQRGPASAHTHSNASSPAPSAPGPCSLTLASKDHLIVREHLVSTISITHRPSSIAPQPQRRPQSLKAPQATDSRRSKFRSTRACDLRLPAYHTFRGRSRGRGQGPSSLNPNPRYLRPSLGDLSHLLSLDTLPPACLPAIHYF